MSKHSVFKVFYKDYVNDVAIKSSEPEELSGDRIAPLAEVLLQHADNFLGIYDGKDTLLQAYLDDDEQIGISRAAISRATRLLTVKTTLGRCL